MPCRTPQHHASRSRIKRVRLLFASLITLSLAVPASASWWPAFSQRAVDLYVGESVSVRITPTWSGLVDYGNGVHWTFRTDSPNVATGSIQMDDSKPQDLRITGIAPGFANVRRVFPSGAVDPTGWVQILVFCGNEVPAIAANPLVRTEIDNPIILTVVSPITSRTMFHWYQGALGDTSQPLDGSGPDLVFTPKTPGAYDIWVAATTTCTSSNVQFHVDVPAAKRRATRH
jgi:hypothetical protein